MTSPRSAPQAVAGWALAFQAQWHLLRRSRRRDFIVFVVMAVGILVMAAFAVRIPVLHGTDAEGGGMTLRFEMFDETSFGMVSAPGLLAVAIGLIVLLIWSLVWSLVVWTAESPSNRGYHWSMPISHFQNDLARVAAGAAWLLAGTVIMAAAAAAGLAASGKTTTLAAVPTSGWVNFVTGPLTVYLMGSVAALLSEHPGRTVFMVWIGFTGPYVLFAIIEFDIGYRIFDAIAGGRFGYQVALTSGLFPRLSAESGGAPSFGPWSVGAVAWLLAGAVAVVWAARRHQET